MVEKWSFSDASTSKLPCAHSKTVIASFKIKFDLSNHSEMLSLLQAHNADASRAMVLSPASMSICFRADQVIKSWTNLILNSLQLGFYF